MCSDFSLEDGDDSLLKRELETERVAVVSASLEANVLKLRYSHVGGDNVRGGDRFHKRRVAIGGEVEVGDENA